ncbi:MarR family winged helix-turn-helix transcriptional regulator [Paenibacillus filicis]|uniref:MarR family winged helix-turn-helix transcriptional regulator n=1 Tax=Paenibacillus gyeongsangnamensis TaxID=3388067 RepID=A0ABT4QAC9_9BACL|nr:MarR family winged helix-turn-helix transcriptional regulator [Paenibacillus filicis]MCZ8513796.1 MarR family winged helix-turn-helix transcriptional regulator [Paenibacillus filicis]
MNAHQQRILYELKRFDRSMSPHSEHFKMDITTLSLELEKLERQGLVELEKTGRDRIRKAKITDKGKEALEATILNQSDVSILDQVKELKEIVDTLQQAMDELNKNKPKEQDIVDKLNKYLTVANGIPNLIKTVIELYGKVQH